METGFDRYIVRICNWIADLHGLASGTLRPDWRGGCSRAAKHGEAVAEPLRDFGVLELTTGSHPLLGADFSVVSALKLTAIGHEMLSHLGEQDPSPRKPRNPPSENAGVIFSCHDCQVIQGCILTDLNIFQQLPGKPRAGTQAIANLTPR